MGGGEPRVATRQPETRSGGPKSAEVDAATAILAAGDGAVASSATTTKIKSSSPSPSPSPPSPPSSPRPRLGLASVSAPTADSNRDAKNSVPNPSPPSNSSSPVQNPSTTNSEDANTTNTSSTRPQTNPPTRRQHSSNTVTPKPAEDDVAAAADEIIENENCNLFNSDDSDALSDGSDDSYADLRAATERLYRDLKRERKEIEKLGKRTTAGVPKPRLSRSKSIFNLSAACDDEPACFYENDEDEMMNVSNLNVKMRAEGLKKDGVSPQPDGFQPKPVGKSSTRNHDLKINGGDDGGGDDSPPSTPSSSDSEDNNSNNSSASYNYNKNSRRHSSNTFNSDEISSSSSGSDWSHDDDDDTTSGSDGTTSSSSSSDDSDVSLPSTRRKANKKGRTRKHKRHNKGRKHRHEKGVNSKHDRAPSTTKLAKITHGVMKTLTHLPDDAGKTPFTPTSDLDKDSEAFYAFLQLLHDAFSRWGPLRNILADAHRDGSIHRVHTAYDEAAYAATHRLFPIGIQNNFMGKQKSVVSALKMMRQKYANGGKDARISRLLTLMKTNMRRDETATDFIERVTSIQRQGIAQKAPIKNRELRDHIMHVLRHSRFYRVEAAALEGTANAGDNKLTLRRVKKHFAKLDKKRRQRAQVVELSNGPQSYPDQRRNQRLPNRRNQAWANSAGIKPRKPLAPLPNGVPPKRYPQNSWNEANQRGATIRRPTPMPRRGNENARPIPRREQPPHASQRLQNVICYNCGERGHMSANCPKRFDRGFRGFRDGNRVQQRPIYNNNRNRQSMNRPNRPNGWRKPLQPQRTANENANAANDKHDHKPESKVAMGAKAEFEQIPTQEEYLGVVVAVFELDEEMNQYNLSEEDENLTEMEDMEIIETDEPILLPTESPPHENSEISENMSTDLPTHESNDMDDLEMHHSAEQVQHEHQSGLRAYITQRTGTRPNLTYPDQHERHITETLQMETSPNLFEGEYENLTALETGQQEPLNENCNMTLIDHDMEIEEQETHLNESERRDFLANTIAWQPKYMGLSLYSMQIFRAVQNLIRASETDPMHPLFTHTSNIWNHSAHCRCAICKPLKRQSECPCIECKTGRINPWLSRQMTMEEVAASAEINDEEIEDLNTDLTGTSDYAWIEAGINNVTQHDFNPTTIIQQAVTQMPRVLTRRDEDHIIQLYESGRYPDDEQLHDDYIEIMARRSGEQSSSSEDSSSTLDNSMDESSIIYDEEILDEEMLPTQEDTANTSDDDTDNDDNDSRNTADILYDHFANEATDKNNDDFDYYCGLVYERDLRADTHGTCPLAAEHFEDEEQPDFLFKTPWICKTDEERMNELQYIMADTTIDDETDDTSSQFFSHQDLQNLKMDIHDTDTVEECANHTQAENASATSINRVYEGSAQSLAHGWLIDSGASCHMTPYKHDLRNIRQCRANVTVADGSKIRANVLGDVTILLPTHEDNLNPARITLRRVLYVPGLNRRLFSVPTFTRLPGHEMTFYENRVHITLPNRKTADVLNDNERLEEQSFANPAITNDRQNFRKRMRLPQMRRNTMKLWERPDIRMKRVKTNDTNKSNKNNVNEGTMVNDSQKILSK